MKIVIISVRIPNYSIYTSQIKQSGKLRCRSFTQSGVNSNQKNKVQQLHKSTMEKPLTYNKITIEKRKQLVQMVINQKISIANAGRMLQIKNSTAKLIVKRYRETGTFFQPKRDLNQENQIQENINEAQSTPQNQNYQPQNNQIVQTPSAQAPLFFYCTPDPQDFFYIWPGWQNYYQSQSNFIYF